MNAQQQRQLFKTVEERTTVLKARVSRQRLRNRSLEALNKLLLPFARFADCNRVVWLQKVLMPCALWISRQIRKSTAENDAIDLEVLTLRAQTTTLKNVIKNNA